MPSAASQETIDMVAPYLVSAGLPASLLAAMWSAIDAAGLTVVEKTAGTARVTLDATPSTRLMVDGMPGVYLVRVTDPDLGSVVWVERANGSAIERTAPVVTTPSEAALIADGTLAYAKLVNIATSTLLGRATAGSGVVEQLTLTAAGRALIDDADAAAQRATLSVAYGTTGTTVCVGNDARLADARTPTAHNQAWSTITATPTTLSGYGVATVTLTSTAGTAGSVYTVGNTVRYRDSGNVERLLLNATDNLANLTNAGTARANLGVGSLLSNNTASSATLTNPGANTETDFSLTYAFPADFWVVGKTVRVTASVEAAGGGLNTLLLRLKIGSVTLSATAGMTLTSTAQQHFASEWIVTCTAVGVSGTLVTTCPFSKRGPAALDDILEQTATVDTTAVGTGKVSATWSTALATNIGTLRRLTWEALN